MAYFKQCPLCGASVKVENIERHVARAHPGKKVEFDLSVEERAAAEEPRRRVGLRRREKLLYPILAASVITAVIIVAIVFAGTGGNNGGPGERAPVFRLPGSDGEVDLNDYANDVILLEFMDTDCHFCLEGTQEYLVQLYGDYEARVDFISVNVRFISPRTDTLQHIQQFQLMTGASWTYALDTSGSVGTRGTVAIDYGVTGTPTYFVIRPGLWIQDRFDGKQSYQILATALDSLLGG